MQVVYSKTFLKDLSKVVPLNRRKQIEKFVFEELPALSSTETAGKIEKLTGYKDYYKIRFGDYWIGIFKNDNTIEIRRVLNRKKIYNYSLNSLNHGGYFFKLSRHKISQPLLAGKCTAY